MGLFASPVRLGSIPYHFAPAAVELFALEVWGKVSNTEPGVRHRNLSLEEGAAGPGQVPDFVLCLLGIARAQTQFDGAAATRSYQQLLDIWKNADPDFIPAQEARRELATLSKNQQ